MHIGQSARNPCIWGAPVWLAAKARNHRLFCLAQALCYTCQKRPEDYSFLLQLAQTRSVFAYTFERNVAERRALQKASFEEVVPMPHAYY